MEYMLCLSIVEKKTKNFIYPVWYETSWKYGNETFRSNIFRKQGKCLVGEIIISVGKFNETNFEVSLREVLTVVVYLLELKSVRSQCINEKKFN